MMDQDIYTKAMINILDERLKFNNLKHKVILYSSSLGYEYNYLTQRIRPINSVFWFNSLNAKAPEFIEFFNELIDSVIDQYDDTGWINNFPFGNCDNGNITIDMDSINIPNINSIVNNKQKAEQIFHDYYHYCKFLIKIYQDADAQFKQIIQSTNLSDII